MPSIRVNGVNLWYELEGKGEILAQIHGLGLGHEHFASITPLLRKKFRVLDYDMRGFGFSDRPLQKYSMELWADDLKGLLDALHIPKAHVHGASMGGMVAMQFALKYPEKLRKLVISCSACKMDNAAKLLFKVWKDVAEKVGVDSEILAELTSVQALSRRYLNSDQGPQALKLVREVFAKNNVCEVFKSACEAIAIINLTDQLHRIRAPTLVLVGEDDIITPLDQGPEGGGSRVIHEKIRRSQLKVVKNCGHALFLEKPEETAETITRFLKKRTD